MTGSGGDVAIVGGGLAGITAALALQETGARATIYEARPRLGGATHSFSRDGLTVDNGQHIFLNCCSAYQGLLARLGAADRVRVQDRFDVRVLTPDGAGGRLRRAKAPGPLHLLPALAGYRLLPPADRLRAIGASLALDRLDTGDPALDRSSMGAWLARHGQRRQAREALWELFVTAALNIRLDEAALGPAAFVCQTALLGRSDAADIGVPTVPLGDLHGTVPAAKIERDGGRIHLGAKVTAIDAGPKLVVNGSPVGADAVVVAVPHRAAAALVPAEASPERARWAGLGSSPIVNVHVIYDRPVLDEPFLCGGTPPHTPRNGPLA
ncbi:FAD-dependent oxidoreductase, partial [Actinomadura darangshiensis]